MKKKTKTKKILQLKKMVADNDLVRKSPLNIQTIEFFFFLNNVVEFLQFNRP